MGSGIALAMEAVHRSNTGLDPRAAITANDAPAGYIWQGRESVMESCLKTFLFFSKNRRRRKLSLNIH
jgi:hypothetical protein